MLIRLEKFNLNCKTNKFRLLVCSNDFHEWLCACLHY